MGMIEGFEIFGCWIFLVRKTWQVFYGVASRGGLNEVGIRGSARVYRPKTQTSISTLFFVLYHLILSVKF